MILAPEHLWYLGAKGTEKASDWHLTAGSPLRVRINGEIVALTNEQKVSSDDIGRLMEAASGRIDHELSVSAGLVPRRYRVHALTAREQKCFVLRAIPPKPPQLATISGLPADFKKLLDRREGLILVGGATGAGKSTTVAACIDYLNSKGGKVIVTLEDPPEFIHKEHANSVIYQRAFGVDFDKWPDALTSAMREDPDVIYVAEMRDSATIEAALRASETGHLVLATVHGGSAASMLDRIISAQSGSARETIAALLANNTIALLAQQLITAKEGGRIALFELLLMTSAAAQTVRAGDVFQIRSVIISGRKDGMQSFDHHIETLFNTQKISATTAREYHSSPTKFSL